MDDVHAGMEKDTISSNEIDKERPTSFLEHCLLRFTSLCNTYYYPFEKPPPKWHECPKAEFQRRYDRGDIVEDKAALGFDLLLRALGGYKDTKISTTAVP